MPYTPFIELFPDLGVRQTRSFTVTDHPLLPNDEYGLIELFCDEKQCDCRRVFFNVYSQKTQALEAVIAYGWANKKFYANWFGHNDPDMIKELQGPCLNMTSSQSEKAPALLELVTQLLKDTAYVKRIKEHYRLFKQVIDADSFDNQNRTSNTKPVERNTPCPCGSGKKYKQCCGKPGS